MKKYLPNIIPALAAYIIAISFSTLSKIDLESSQYYGTDVMGWNPVSIVILAIGFVLFKRFISHAVLKNKGRVILSVVLGLFISFLGVWGKLMLYQSYAVFDTPGHIKLALILPIGLALLFVPVFSEITGLVDLVKEKYAAPIDAKTKLSLFFDAHPIAFFFIVWAVIFVTYLPLFLYWWPGNFIYDAGDEIRDYIEEGRLSTHHPLMHILLLGYTYSLGVKWGNPASGLQLYTLLQMLLLSAAFSYMIYSVRKRKPSKVVYYIVLFVTILNPFNGFMAVSSAKGVIGTALFVFAIVLLLNTLESDKWKWWNIAGFVLLTIGACHFRNNMVYAVLAGGTVIALLQKGWKKKLIIFLAVVMVFAGYKLSFSGLKASMHAADAYPIRESMSVPLQCMVRVAINNKDDMPSEYYEELCNYIPEQYFSEYSTFLSDGIKGNTIEAALRGNVFNFIKLFIKIGLKYPGEYIESVIGLTIGYWYPFNYPYWTSGSNVLDVKLIGTAGAQQITIKHLIPFAEGFYTWYFDEGGRLELPVFGWFWRGTIYTWTTLFAFGYCIYSKNKKGLSLVMIPLCYLLTCFLGPVSFIRYIYVNIALFPMMFYAMADERKLN